MKNYSALPVSTKINVAGKKATSTAAGGKASSFTSSPYGANNATKGTGLDGKAADGAGGVNQNQPKLLNEDSMTRLISLQNPKKSTGGVTQPISGNAMNSYIAQ